MEQLHEIVEKHCTAGIYLYFLNLVAKGNSVHAKQTN